MKPNIVVLACHSAAHTHYSIKVADHRNASVHALSVASLFNLRDICLHHSAVARTSAHFWTMHLGSWAIKKWEYVPGCWCRQVRQNLVDEATTEHARPADIVKLGAAMIAELAAAEAMVVLPSRKHKLGSLRLRPGALNEWIEEMALALFGFVP